MGQASQLGDARPGVGKKGNPSKGPGPAEHRRPAPGTRTRKRHDDDRQTRRPEKRSHAPEKNEAPPRPRHTHAADSLSSNKGRRALTRRPPGRPLTLLARLGSPNPSGASAAPDQPDQSNPAPRGQTRGARATPPAATPAQPRSTQRPGPASTTDETHRASKRQRHKVPIQTSRTHTTRRHSQRITQYVSRRPTRQPQNGAQK